MTEVYTKGTRIWIADKDQGWISAEITSNAPVGDNALKLTFVDERGKVTCSLTLPARSAGAQCVFLIRFCRSTFSTPQKRKRLRYETLHYSKLSMTSPRSPILTNHQVTPLSHPPRPLQRSLTRPSPPYHPESICPAQHLHLLGHRPNCNEPLPTRHALRTRDHPSLRRSEKGRTRAPSLRHRRGRVYPNAEGQHWPDHHRVRRVWCRKDRICTFFRAGRLPGTRFSLSLG